MDHEQEIMNKFLVYRLMFIVADGVGALSAIGKLSLRFDLRLSPARGAVPALQAPLPFFCDSPHP